MNQLRNNGYEIILLIDANESIDQPNSKLAQFAATNCLHDVQALTIDELPKSTRLGSKKRIDYIFATEGIAQHTTAAGYLALHEGIISDHILLWADFDLESFFGGNASPTAKSTAAAFLSTNIDLRNKFLAKLRDIYTHQNIFKRIISLEISIKVLGITDELIYKYNNLDRDIVRAIKTAVNATSNCKNTDTTGHPI